MMVRPYFGAAALIAVLGLSACAGTSAGLATGPLAGPLAAPRHSADVFDSKVPVSGTYDGSIKETENGKSHSGSVVFTITQSKKSISGSVKITVGSRSATLPLSGRVKSDGTKNAKIVFIVEDSKGRNANARATITLKKLVGKGTVPPDGTKPGVSLTFTTTRE